MLGPLLLPEPMSWHRRATWEWVKIAAKGCMHALAPKPANWHDCSAGTCDNLDRFTSADADLVGKRVHFNDSYGVSRVFTCVSVNDANYLILRHPHVSDEGEVVLMVRPISIKLLRCRYIEALNEISVDSAVSGDNLLIVPYKEYSKYTWGMFAEVVNKAMKLPPGRIVLFPPDTESPEDMMVWKQKPRVRVQVRSLLKVVNKEYQDKKKRYGPKKRPAASSSIAKASTS